MSKNRTRTFGIEKLDDRSMLAGNVSASLAGGELLITGDSKANTILVTQSSNGNWTVRGLPSIDGKATKINGATSATFSEVFGITINTGNGNDIVGVANGLIPCQLSVNTGANKDLVALVNLEVGGVDVSTGGDSDALIVVGLQIFEKEESPSIVPFGLPFDSSAFFDTGAGNDLVLLAGVKAPNLTLNTGKGNDFSGLLGVCVDGALCVDTGDGIDMLGVVKSSASFAKLNGGSKSGEVLASGKNSFGSKTTDFKQTINLDPIIDSVANTLKSLPKSLSSVMGTSGLKALGLKPIISI